MKRVQTRGIVLSRTNFGEADRIITVLTPDHGKLRLMARGVRKAGAKLAGSIELFSTADVTFIEGRGEIGTLVSARLVKHYGRIIQNIERVQLGYELIKMLDRATEDRPEPEYYDLLEQTFAALDDQAINSGLIEAWFAAQLLRLAGHSPNLKTDTEGRQLAADSSYELDLEAMAFTPRPGGQFTSGHIKLLRLLFTHQPRHLAKIEGLEGLLSKVGPPIQRMLQAFVRM